MRLNADECLYSVVQFRKMAQILLHYNFAILHVI